MVRLAGVLSRYLERGLIPSLVTRVIVSTEKVREVALDYASRIREALTQAGILRTLAQRFQALGLIAEIGDITTHILAVKEIPRFRLTAFPATLRILEELEADKRIEKVYPDRIVTILEYPTVSKEQVFLDKVTKKPFTTTYYTRKILGAEQANKEGYTGKGVKVAIIDTTAAPQHTAILHAIPRTTIRGIYTDSNGHGCIRNALVYTSFCGVKKIEEMWDAIETEPIKVGGAGEFKTFPYHVYTIGYSGIVRVKGVYRTRVNKKVRITTPLGTIEATPWHKFLVVRPVRNRKRDDYHRRWRLGYEILWKRADELKTSTGGYTTDRDYLLIKPYKGESWTLGIDPKLAYIAGYMYGDATVIVRGVNVRTGKVYEAKWTHHEIYANDADPTFLSRIGRICKRLGATSFSIRKHSNPKDNCFLLLVYGKKFVTSLAPLVVNPPINDLEAMRAWIAGFFDAEGYVDPGRKRVKIVQNNKDILEKLACFLTSIGIPATVSSGGCSKGSRAWHLIALDIKAFYKLVEPYVIKKKNELKSILKSADRIHAKTIRRVDNYIAVPVNKVETVKEEGYLYDLAHSSDSTYLANGIVSHNTWCTAAIGGRYYIDVVYGVPTQGLAPDATLFTIKALYSPLGFGNESDILEAMDLAVTLGADIVSMSLGSEEVPSSPEDDPQIQAVEKLTRENNIIFCIAAGNSGPGYGTINSPGAADSAITVGAYCPITGKVASFSSRGPTPWGTTKPDITMPGVNILAPTVGLLDALEMPRGAVRSSALSGTSMATPHASGMVALMVEYAGRHGVRLTAEMVKDLMSRYGEDVKNNDSGWGVLTWDKWKRYAGEVLGI
jgi:subtilisin family serine protease